MLLIRSRALAMSLTVLITLAATPSWAAAPPPVVATITAAVDAPDRPDADRKLDASRRPKDMLAFFGVAPGMKILDMFAGGGWYTELEARVAGPTGEVYAHNPPEFLAKYGDKGISERLSGDRLPTVRRWDRSLDDLQLPKAHFDGVIANDVFHDFYWLSKDVDAVIRQVYDAVKPGGFFAIVDHSAPPGTGNTFAVDRAGQHRIDEEFVKERLIRAGFRLDATSDLLRNPQDDRLKPFFAPEMKGKDPDKFALLCRKPR